MIDQYSSEEVKNKIYDVKIDNSPIMRWRSQDDSPYNDIRKNFSYLMLYNTRFNSEDKGTDSYSVAIFNLTL